MKNIINELTNIAKTCIWESSADNCHALIEKFSFERANVLDKSETLLFICELYDITVLSDDYFLSMPLNED